ncbi:uncharacterized protein LOC114645839 isoform X2 [Erpetoichthys calabaricus]|uniref:uncharacterized protein LOC114645839 isoform X2 n=1 Tax=Erpetoichthys calabaricus TaxID=27687 RepID=UPI0022341D6E|nr:uncharacterized protein LOC114645839 isoform X2 [Erpetoichthys calabaricus]
MFIFLSFLDWQHVRNSGSYSVSWVFLALLLLLHPLSILPVSSDIIALRFLSFLSHTYGALLLLAIPLIATEMLCRFKLPHPLLGKTEGEFPNGYCNFLLQAPTFLFALLSWVIAADYSGQFLPAEVDLINDCFIMHQGGSSLTQCLPDLYSTLYLYNFYLPLVTLLVSTTFSFCYVISIYHVKDNIEDRIQTLENSGQICIEADQAKTPRMNTFLSSMIVSNEEQPSTVKRYFLKSLVCLVCLFLFSPVLALNTSLLSCTEDLSSCILNWFHSSRKSTMLKTTF